MNKFSPRTIFSKNFLMIIGFLIVGYSTASLGADHSSDKQILSPSKAIALAIKNNPTLKAAVLTREKASYAVEAEAGLYPFMLQMDAGVTHSSNPVVDETGDVSHGNSNNVVVGAQLAKTFAAGTRATFRVEGNRLQKDSSTNELAGPIYGSTARLTVTQPLLRGAGKEVVQASYRQALKAEDIAELTSRKVAGDTVLSVLNAYWDLWLSERSVEIEQQARILAQQYLTEIQLRVNEGDEAEIAELSYLTRLASLEESVVEAAETSENRSLQLAALLGFSDSAGKQTSALTTLAEIEPIWDSEQRRGEKSVEDAFASSPEIRVQLAAISLAEEKSRVAGESMRHRLDLTGWVGASTLGYDEVSPVMSQYGNGEAYMAYLGLVYELPLSDQRKKAQQASARSDVDIANEQLQVMKDNLKADVLSAEVAIKSAETRLRLAQKTLEVANRQAAAERERHALGDSIYLQVREAEDAVRQAALRISKARVDLLKYQLKRDYLTGHLLTRVGAKL